MLRRVGVRIALFATAGVLIGFATAFINPVYVSEATLVVRRLSGDAGELAGEACGMALSRRSLRSIVDEHHLYRAELDRVPYEDVFDMIRSSTTFEHVPQAGGPKQLRVTFHHVDRATAGKVMHELMRRVAGFHPSLEVRTPPALVDSEKRFTYAGVFTIAEPTPVPSGARGELRQMISRLGSNCQMIDGPWPEELRVIGRASDPRRAQEDVARIVPRIMSNDQFKKVFAPRDLAIALEMPPTLPDRPEGLGQWARGIIGALTGILLGVAGGRPRDRVLTSLF